mmetsp:Transcript_16747/g.25309  ORF Transcript_16747/g.25309 Transcript_16747/m.25309 type:complete len:455 (+) Transcript_16747:354-1718(+)
MNQSRNHNYHPKRDYEPATNLIGKEAGGVRRRRDNSVIACDDIIINHKINRNEKRRDHSVISSDIRMSRDRREKVHTRRDQSVIVNENTTLKHEADKDRRRRRRYSADHAKELSQQKRVSENRKHRESSSRPRNRKGSDFRRELNFTEYEHGTSSNVRKSTVSKNKRAEERLHNSPRRTTRSSTRTNPIKCLPYYRSSRSHSSKYSSSSSSRSNSSLRSASSCRTRSTVNTSCSSRSSESRSRCRDRHRSNLHNRIEHDDSGSPLEGLSQVIQGYLEIAFGGQGENGDNSDETITRYLKTCFEKEYYLLKEFYQRRRKQGCSIKSDQELAQQLQHRFSEEFERYMGKKGDLHPTGTIKESPRYRASEERPFYSRHENEEESPKPNKDLVEGYLLQCLEEKIAAAYLKKCVEEAVGKHMNDEDDNKTSNLSKKESGFYEAYPNLGSAIQGNYKRF